MPVSAKQLAANRANARKSTGPRTPAGKARSSRNNIRHGLCTSLRLIPGEDPEEYNAFAKTILKDLKPAGTFEVALANRIALNHWRLRRAGRAEASLLTKEPFTPDPPAHVRFSLDALSRHESRFHRLLHRDLATLETLQSARHRGERALPQPNNHPADRFDRWGRLPGPNPGVPLHAQRPRHEDELGLDSDEPGPHGAAAPG